MFKKLLLAVVVLVVGAWVTVWVLGTLELRQNVSRKWAAGLGRVDDVPKRFPAAEQSEGATRLVQLADAAGVNLLPKKRGSAQPQDLRKAIGDYTKAQFERSGDAIDAPPPAVARYLAANAAALDAVRDHILGGAPIVWETRVTGGFDQPAPNLVGHMDLQRVLMARAFDKARVNDPGAWNELRASWELDRGLWLRPDLISILVALGSTRMQNAAARKMPLPAPPWFAETRRFDYAAAMAAAQQADAWSIAHFEPSTPVSLWQRVKRLVDQPIERYRMAHGIESMQRSVDAIVGSKGCDVESEKFEGVRARLITQGFWFYDPLPNLLGAWQRVLRFQAEREATDRVLQIRAGQMPATQSRCSDGAWVVTANAFQFSREVKVPPPGIRYPLEYSR